MEGIQMRTPEGRECWGHDPSKSGNAASGRDMSHGETIPGVGVSGGWDCPDPGLESLAVQG